MLSFAINDMELVEGGPGDATWRDKVPSKFARWTDRKFRNAGLRAAPGSIVRRGAFIGRGAVLMPSFVNIGAHVGAGTMVDTWASVGSCAPSRRELSPVGWGRPWRRLGTTASEPDHH